MTELEISDTIHSFGTRQDEIKVKIQELKLERAKLELEYGQFMAKLSRARILEHEQFEANLDALDRAQALDDQLPQPHEELN